MLGSCAMKSIELLYHLAHLENSDMPLKDFLKAYKVKMRELTDEEVIYTP